MLTAQGQAARLSEWSSLLLYLKWRWCWLGLAPDQAASLCLVPHLRLSWRQKAMLSHQSHRRILRTLAAGLQNADHRPAPVHAEQHHA
jgi:hypothetical protein